MSDAGVVWDRDHRVCRVTVLCGTEITGCVGDGVVWDSDHWVCRCCVGQRSLGASGDGVVWDSDHWVCRVTVLCGTVWNRD